MDSYVDTFLEDYSVTDPGAKDSLIEVINSCFKVYAEYMSKDLLTDKKVNKADKKAKDPKDPKEPKPAKAAKSERKVLENPAEATSMDALNGCTIQILAKWCKDHEMKVGGKKEEVIARVWRHLQGETSDEDKTPKARPRKKSAEKEQHQCDGLTKAGKPCVLAGTTCVDGKWLCFRHNPENSKETAAEKKAIDSLESLEAKVNESNDSSDSSGSGSSGSESDSSSDSGESEPETPVVKETTKAKKTPVAKAKAPAKPQTVPKKASPKKKIIELSEE